MTKVNNIGASGQSATVYGGGSVGLDADAGGKGSSILDYDAMPKGMDDYVETAQKEYLQRRGDLQQSLAATDDPAEAEQLQQQLDQLDSKFAEFRDSVANSVEAGAFEKIDEVVDQADLGGVQGTDRATDLNPGMVFNFRPGGPEELQRLQGAAESFFDELQAGWDASQPQRIDPPHVDASAARVDHNDYDRAAEKLRNDPDLTASLDETERQKLDQMFDLMSKLRPQKSQNLQLDKIRG